jgi:hypothetical protein
MPTIAEPNRQKILRPGAYSAAQSYAQKRMRIFPTNAAKRPLIEHGHLGASTDSEMIEAWWARWPFASPAWAIPDDVVVVDIEHDGFKAFEELAGMPVDAVETPTSVTGRGGRHLFFKATVAHKNAVRLNGQPIDVRCSGGYVLLPFPGSGRRWLPNKPRTMAPEPDWLTTLAVRPTATSGTPASAGKLPKAGADADSGPRADGAAAYPGVDSDLGMASLVGMIRDIRDAPNGHQEVSLNNMALRIGSLIAAGELGEHAVGLFKRAAFDLPSYDPRRPWSKLEISKKIDRGVDRGRLQPRRERP